MISTINPKYRIVPKLDFGPGPGYLIEGEYVKKGFIVTDGICNIMPGATWFRTIEDAEWGIKAYDMAAGDGREFWNILKSWELLKLNR